MDKASGINLIFSGLARDCEAVIEANVKSIIALRDRFEISSLHFLIAENDSQDATRLRLIEISKKFDCIELVLLAPLDRIYPERVSRIAFCRELLLQKVREKVSRLGVANTLYVPADLDSQIFASVDSEKFINDCYLLLSSNKLDAIFPSGEPFYYDILALRSEHWCNSDCLYDLKRFQKYHSRFLYYLGWFVFITRRQKSSACLASKARFIAVDSAFGGFGIYSASAIASAHYFMSSWPQDIYFFQNEHVLFNQFIASKAIDTDLVVASPTEHLAQMPRSLCCVVRGLLIALCRDFISLSKCLLKQLHNLISR